MQQQVTMQPQQDLSPQVIQDGIAQMKKGLSQIDGECTTLRIEAQGRVFQNMIQICGTLLQQIDRLKKDSVTKQETLDKIFNAHPDIKIQFDKAKKEEHAKEAKKPKIVKKG